MDTEIQAKLEHEDKLLRLIEAICSRDEGLTNLGSLGAEVFFSEESDKEGLSVEEKYAIENFLTEAKLLRRIEQQADGVSQNCVKLSDTDCAAVLRQKREDPIGYKERWMTATKRLLTVEPLGTTWLHERDLNDAWEKAIARVNEAFLAVHDAHFEGPNGAFYGAVACADAASDLFERYADRYEFSLDDLAHLAARVVHRHCRPDDYWDAVIDHMKYLHAKWHADQMLEEAREKRAKATHLQIVA